MTSRRWQAAFANPSGQLTMIQESFICGKARVIDKPPKTNVKTESLLTKLALSSIPGKTKSAKTSSQTIGTFFVPQIRLRAADSFFLTNDPVGLFGLTNTTAFVLGPKASSSVFRSICQ